MSLINYSLLGFLNFSPKTGYDLKKAMDESTQIFWHAELSQIYPALQQLEKSGLVTCETQAQSGRPVKKIYSITPAGREALLAWLAEPMSEIPAIKNPVLLKLFFAGALPKTDLLRQLYLQLDLQQTKFAEIRGQSKKSVEGILNEAEGDLTVGMWAMVRQYGEMQAALTIQWLQNAIETIEQGESRAPARH